MGSIRSAIENFDGIEEKREEAKQNLSSLSALASAKADFFELKITEELHSSDAPNSKEIPVSVIKQYGRETHAYSSKNADNISEAVKNTVNKFCSGTREGIINGITGLIGDVVTTLFGSQEGSEEEIKWMTCYAEGVSLVRLDLRAWKRFIEVKTLQTSVEQISAFVMTKSIIDAKNLDYTVFLNFYQDVLAEKRSGYSTEEIKKLMDDVGDIYETFKRNQERSPASREISPRLLGGTLAEKWIGPINPKYSKIVHLPYVDVVKNNELLTQKSAEIAGMEKKLSALLR
jgi:hypothetical protein